MKFGAPKTRKTRKIALKTRNDVSKTRKRVRKNRTRFVGFLFVCVDFVDRLPYYKEVREHKHSRHDLLCRNASNLSLTCHVRPCAYIVGSSRDVKLQEAATTT